jgi:putative NIF3 family GTP cyclohydrolase 1 type 2
MKSTDLGSIAVLLEAPFDSSRRQKNSVLLTIDLTTAVADEAIKNRNSAVVAYRKSYPGSSELR